MEKISDKTLIELFKHKLEILSEDEILEIEEEEKKGYISRFSDVDLFSIIEYTREIEHSILIEALGYYGQLRICKFDGSYHLIIEQ